MFIDHKSIKYLFDKKELNIRKRRWIEFVKDYDFTLQYHPWKANIVTNALRRKQVHLSVVAVKGLELLKQFRDLNLNKDSSIDGLHCGTITMQNGLMSKIKAIQQDYEVVQEKKKLVEAGNAPEFKLGLDDILQCHGRVCVPGNVEL